jgi:hypothetical protein
MLPFQRREARYMTLRKRPCSLIGAFCEKPWGQSYTFHKHGSEKGADKLVRLIDDFGDHKRIILAGIIQQREDPTKIEGKQASFLC